MKTFNWKHLFAPGESPYRAMFRAGNLGVPIDQVTSHCYKLGIPLREKDIRAWEEGNWKSQMRKSGNIFNPIRPDSSLTTNRNYVSIAHSKLSDYDSWPDGWTGTDQRWFPCSQDNRPLQKWGYSDEYTPQLYDRDTAIALSPVGWVGQNMYAQPFVVFDIDGEGHGQTDEQVIEFGTQFANLTETWRNEAKPGSFHLYFATPHRIPIGHFPYAKLDLMGNDTNAAVYTKNKVPNGLPRITLTEEIWDCMQQYVQARKKQRDEELNNL